MSDDKPVPCTIPCDYCGESPARWFGETSVAVCTKIECRQRAIEAWEEHCARIANERDEDYDD